ncbi:hypothetical protein E6C55_25475 [Cohnella fermenti]|uniref:Uncharacterized protein n=2 Tax=Cohnella fermenti TaxID=2565925 RepID=A0A4S4BII4_9BACL|nr:hypothetical protein E6C55_25475 [Cohnella fermenti]
MLYAEFKRKLRRAYPDNHIAFSSNVAQHLAQVGPLKLYTNAGSEAIYGLMNAVSVGRATGIE